jgi:hypothetical protein
VRERYARDGMVIMKNDKTVLVILVVAILISGTLMAGFAYKTWDDHRIAYISVKTDKTSYEAGEKVTFKLIDNTPDIDFNVTDPNNSPEHMTYSLGAINIVKIPDGIDPDWVVDHLLANENLATKPFRADTYVATIHYGYFSSEHSPLNLSWDGKIGAYNDFTDGFTSFPATSGDYLVLPDFQYASIPQIHFKIDDNAIFHYNSLGASINMTVNPNNNVTVKLRLTSPPGTAGNLNAELFSNLRYPETGEPTVGNVTVIVSNHFFNDTVVIDPTVNNISTIVFNVKVPDNGEISQTIFFDALLVTSIGNYTFGFNGNWWNGGWVGMNQY